MLLGKNAYRNLIALGLLGLLFLPLFESKTHIKGIKPLAGTTDDTDTLPEFSARNWANGSFQRLKQKEVNDSFGFRNIFVRLKNQIDYSLFGKFHATDVVFGKDNYLFDKRYLAGYSGTDKINSDSIKNMFNRVSFLSDTLSKLNKSLLLVIAPNKANYYPEFLPDGFKIKDTATNYKMFKALLQKGHVHYIDFNSLFVTQKNKSKYPLLPKNGTHWSMYGATLAGDSILNYLQKLSNIKLPEPVITYGPLRQDSAFDTDLEDLLNLLFWFKHEYMEYPRVSFKSPQGTIRPNVLIIGDSYYWGLSAAFNIENAFSEKSVFWYYYRNKDHSKITSTELKNALTRSDVILIVATAHNLADVGWGFLENASSAFKYSELLYKTPYAYSKGVVKIINDIKNNDKWMHEVEKEATTKGISVDSSLILNALWVIDHNNKSTNQ